MQLAKLCMQPRFWGDAEFETGASLPHVPRQQKLIYVTNAHKAPLRRTDGHLVYRSPSLAGR